MAVYLVGKVDFITPTYLKTWHTDKLGKQTKNTRKQAGAELCQARFKLSYLNVKVYKANYVQQSWDKD